MFVSKLAVTEHTTLKANKPTRLASLKHTVYGGAVLLYLAVSVFFIIVVTRRTLMNSAFVLLSVALVLLAYLKMAPRQQAVQHASIATPPTQQVPSPTDTAAPTAPLLTPTPHLPRLHQDTTAYYAPGSGEFPGTLRRGTVYTITARYGWNWLQADFAGQGRLWVAEASLAAPDLALPALPNLAPAATHSLSIPTDLLRSGEHAPRLAQDTPVQHAPGSMHAAAGTIASNTPYDLLARYGSEWVQADFAGHGQRWGRAADMGFASADLSALPNLAPIVGYGIHVTTPGEDLSAVAALGGSEAALIASYNRVDDSLAPGHPLIVPHLEGRTSALPRKAFIARRGNTAQPRVALTVDVEVGDIWHLLDVLRQRGAHATFFVTGAWAQAHPDMLRQIVADGHELGNHSFSHPDFRLLNQAQIASELAETERIVHEHTGATTRPFFRPPYGGYDERVLLSVIDQGYLPVFWTIDSQDAVGAPRSPAFLAQQITGTFAPEQIPGTIALSHCCAARHRIADAMPTILDRFAEVGIEVHPLSDVLGE